MSKEEYIQRYGKAAYEKKVKQGRVWAGQNRKRWANHNREGLNENQKHWRENHPDKVKASNQESCRKGGKYYEATLKWHTTGLPGEREKVRKRHGHRYRKYKQIIAPESQIHHEWIPETANYTGVALVEADQHQHGYIDVVQILEGEITLLTEAEIKIEGN